VEVVTETTSEGVGSVPARVSLVPVPVRLGGMETLGVVVGVDERLELDEGIGFEEVDSASEVTLFCDNVFFLDFREPLFRDFVDFV